MKYALGITRGSCYNGTKGDSPLIGGGSGDIGLAHANEDDDELFSATHALRRRACLF